MHLYLVINACVLVSIADFLCFFMYKHCNNARGIIIHPLKQIFPSPLCNHWQKVPLYITKVSCSVRMLNKVMFWASFFFLSSWFQAWGCAGVCWVEAVGWGQSRSAWSAVSFSLQCMPSCKYLQSILWEAWVFTAKACGSTLRVCMYMSSEEALLLSLCVFVGWGTSLGLSTVC